MESRFAKSGKIEAPLPIAGGPTFSRQDRARRVIWRISWALFAAWTPPAWMPVRRWLLRRFGGEIHHTAMVRGGARIWWPGHLRMEANASLGPETICYNVARITIREGAIVSQRAHLCSASHDIDDPDLPLVSRPITIGPLAWIAAEAFVGPGVTVGEGSVRAPSPPGSGPLDGLFRQPVHRDTRPQAARASMSAWMRGRNRFQRRRSGVLRPRHRR